MRGAVGLSSRLVALIVGSAPTLLLPFVAATVLQPDEAATLLIGLAIAIAVTGIIASSFEAGVLAEVARARHGGYKESLVDLHRVGARGMIVALPVTVVLTPTLLLMFAITGQQLEIWSADLLEIVPLLVAPVVASSAAAFSASLVGASRVTPVLYSAFLRGGPSIVLLLATDSVALVSAAYLAGEVARLLMLRGMAQHQLQRVSSDRKPVPDWRLLVPSARGLANQAGSAALSQGNPLVTRIFLLGVSPTAFVVGEMAARVQTVGSQIISSAYIMPAIPRIPAHLSHTDPHSNRRGVMMQSIRAFAFGLGTSLIAVIAILTMLAVIGDRLDPAVEQGMIWGLPYAIALPFLSANLWAARALIYVKLSRYLPVVASLTLVLVVGLSLLFAKTGEGSAIVWASSLTQVVVGVFAVALAAIVVPPAAAALAGASDSPS